MINSLHPAKSFFIFLRNSLLGVFLLLTLLLLPVQNASAQCDTSSTPSGNCSFGDAIDYFTFASVVSSNYGCSSGSGYTKYNSQQFRTVMKGSTYNFYMEVGGFYYAQGAAIWIDYDSDGYFEDTEQAWASSTYDYTFSGNITIPVTAATGVVRMRVRCGYYAFFDVSDMCNNVSTYGETEDYLIRLDAPPAKDAGVTAVLNPVSGCGGNDSVRVTLKNFGTDALTSTSVSVLVTGSIGGSAISPTTLTRTFSGNLAYGQSTTFAIGPLNTAAGALINLKAYTSLSSDATASNDTTLSNVLLVAPNTTPTVPNVKSCGNGPATLTASSSAGANFAWSTTSNPLVLAGYGSPYTTGPLTVNGSPYTFYASAFKSVKDTFLNSPNLNTYGFYGNQADKGFYFNITSQNNVIIDSFDVMMAGAAGQSVQFDVYVKSGTYRGFEQQQSSWTLVGSQTLVTPGTANAYVRLAVGKISLNANSMYGFYIVGRNMSINTTVVGHNTPATIKTYGFEMTVTSSAMGALGNGPFSSNSLFDGYQFQGKIYGKSVCRTSFVAGTVTVVPKPFGATLTQGPVFKGFFRAGTQGTPDYTIVSDSAVSYLLTPPTGFSNSGYGSTWNIQSVSLKTVKGTAVPSSQFSYSPPSGGNPGGLVFQPNSAFIDSVIRIDVTIRNLNPSNLCDSVISRFIHVTPLPKVNFATDNVCRGIRSVFNNLTTIESGTVTYDWNFGDGTGTSTFTHPEYVYPAHGTFNVKLTATSSYGFKKDTTITVTIFEIPNVDFTKINACEGDSISFTNATTIGAGSIAYTWKFGDGNQSSLQHPKHLYSVVGAYDVTLVALANGCEASISKKVHQFPRPRASFTAENIECSSTEASFTSTSTIASGKIGHVWDFGDGNRATLTNPKHTYTSFGVKTIKLKTISEFACADSVTQTITLKESPVVSFTNDMPCSNDPVKFVDNTTQPPLTVLVYKWHFGDGDSSTAVNPSHKYNSLGPKTVKLRVDASNGCSGEMTRLLNVQVQPTANFTAENVCSGEEVKFANKSTVAPGTQVNYKWDFGDGQGTSTAFSPKYVYNTVTTQNYNAKLVAVAVNGCSDTAEKPVRVYAVPNCNFVVANMGNMNYSFTPASNSGLTYLWLFGDGSTSTNGIPQYKYGAYGTYTVTMIGTSTDGGCICSQTQTISVNTSVAELKNKGTSVEVYPNPGKGDFKVNIAGNSSKSLNIEVYNVVGAKIRTIPTAGLLNGEFSLDLNDCESGVYLIRIDTGKEILTRKVTLTR